MKSTVYVVDDDAATLLALSRVLRFAGHTVLTFSSPEQFLSQLSTNAEGCIILDVAMPELDGFQVEEALVSRGIELPIIFLTGHGDIPMSVRAIKRGAVDFLTKPVQKQALLAAISDALSRLESRRADSAHKLLIRKRLVSLTPREHQVMVHVVAGEQNKWIARELGTVEQTIKVHRGRVMHKMQADSLADLIRMAQHLDLTAR